MEIAPDGSPVLLYRRLSARVEDAALIHTLLPASATVLDLGCGTGRVAEPLAALGHNVTGVDEEARMLATMRLTTPVCADITTLDLGSRFDAVLLLSHLVDNADPGFVIAALRAARRHVLDSGVVFVERYAPGWATTCTAYTRETGGVRYTMHSLHRVDGVLTATLRYEFDSLSVEQRFSVRDVDDRRLAELAAGSGFVVGPRLNRSGTLVPLRPEEAQPRGPA